jgi:cation diffusion facilitator family transporter
MGDIPQLYREARRAAAWGIAVSLGLGLMKLLGGLFGGSLALQTDAVHSLVDAIISGTLLGALTVAERPADPEHPYGHTRVEAVAGLSIALILVLLALGIGWEALRTLSSRRDAPEPYTLAIALVGIAIQEALYRRAIRAARRTGSGALAATAWDYRLDAIGSLVVLAGVALATWGGPRWLWADNAAAAVAAATILWVAVGLFRDNAEELIDRQADPALLDAVRREALAVPGVRGVETLRVRKAGLEYLVDIHVEVDPEQTVRQGHDIAHAVKRRIIRNVPPIRDVLVHIEPSPVK